MTRQKILGCLLGFAGVVLINWNGGALESSMKWNGEGFIFLAALSYAISSVLIKDYSVKENPMILSGYQFTVGGLIMAVSYTHLDVYKRQGYDYLENNE